ncbi:MAG: hypothetical protein ACREUE_14585, partial [Panacagrimonas sp.]
MKKRVGVGAIRALHVVVFAMSLLLDPALAADDATKLTSLRPLSVGARLGGDAGRPVFGQSAFALPAPNLDAKQLRDFAFGNRLFNTNWVIAGSSTASFDG